MECIAILFWSSMFWAGIAFMVNIPKFTRAFDKWIQKPKHKKQCMTDIVMQGYYEGRARKWHR